LQILRRLNSIKYSRASFSFKWANGELTNVLRAVCVIVIRELTDSDVLPRRDIPVLTLGL